MADLTDELAKVGPLLQKPPYKTRGLKQLEHYFHVLRQERFSIINRMRVLRNDQVSDSC